MSAKPTIGFVILVWNSQNVIEKCLNSIVNLQCFNSYIIIVDNGSSDDTPIIVDRYISEYPTIISKISYPQNMGTTVSRNDGIKLVKKISPDYYCVLDSDTEINDDAFIKLTNEMNRYPEYGIIGPAMSTTLGVEQVSARCFPTALEKLYKAIPIQSIQAIGERMERQEPTMPNASSYPVDYLMSACWLIRPSVFERVGLLDERIFYAPEDAEYCIRVWQSGYVVAYCPDAHIVHEWQRLSKKRLISKMNWEHIKGLAYMFKKHHYLLTSKNIRQSTKS